MRWVLAIVLLTFADLAGWRAMAGWWPWQEPWSGRRYRFTPFCPRCGGYVVQGRCGRCGR